MRNVTCAKVKDEQKHFMSCGLFQIFKQIQLTFLFLFGLVRNRLMLGQMPTTSEDIKSEVVEPESGSSINKCTASASGCGLLGALYSAWWRVVNVQCLCIELN